MPSKFALVDPSGRVAQLADKKFEVHPALRWIPAGELEVDDQVDRAGKLVKRHAFKGPAKQLDMRTVTVKPGGSGA